MSTTGRGWVRGSSWRDRWWAGAVPWSGPQPACLLQVDELYEGYCIQWRLRDGASNMQRAFSNGTQSRASRESLQELGRSLQECMEVGQPRSLCPSPWSGLPVGAGAGK